MDDMGIPVRMWIVRELSQDTGRDGQGRPRRLHTPMIGVSQTDRGDPQADQRILALGEIGRTEAVFLHPIPPLL